MNTPDRDLSRRSGEAAEADRLDAAIDQVAARMVAVPDDGEMTLRIVSALPERPAWSLHWLMPRLAITAALAIAALGITVVLRTFDDRSTAVLRSAVLSSPAVELAAAALEHRTTREPASIVRRTFVEPSQSDRRTTDVLDHERSLPAIAAMRSLDFDSLAPVSLPEDAPLTLEPLAIADLPLTTDSFSPR